jgi:hypothetical protein
VYLDRVAAAAAFGAAARGLPAVGLAALANRHALELAAGYARTPGLLVGPDLHAAHWLEEALEGGGEVDTCRLVVTPWSRNACTTTSPAIMK